MVMPFNFARLPYIFFGRGKSKSLPGILKSYGKRIALITGQNSLVTSPAGSDIMARLEAGDIIYRHLVIPGEPSPEMIDDAAKTLRNDQVDAVLSIGGGSVIDAGKAISAMIRVQGSVIDFLEGVGTKEHPGIKVPFIAVPTTSGTGSEATKNAVISESGMNGFKKSLRHDNFVPDIAVVDPLLTLSCPPDITAASGLDCFTQLAEAYLSDRSVEYTDALAIEGFRAIKRSLQKCFTDGSDIEAREDMSFAALTSGICLANAGLGAVHGLASTIGGMYNIPHGLVCGTLMAQVNMHNVSELRRKLSNPRALKKYADLGRIFIDQKDKTEDYYIDGFIDYLFRITDEFGLPGLKKFGLNNKDVRLICEKTDLKNNPVKLSVEELIEIVSSRV